MRPKPILYLIVVLLAIAALAVPLLLRQMPLPLRFLVGFSNLLASFAVAMFIRQARKANFLGSQARRTDREQTTPGR